MTTKKARATKIGFGKRICYPCVSLSNGFGALFYKRQKREK